MPPGVAAPPGFVLRIIALSGLLLAAGEAGDSRLPRSVPGRFEVEGFDFRPQGAWRRRTNAIRLARDGLLRDQRLALLNGGGAGTAVAGHYLVPVIPIAFQNVPPPFPESTYQRALFAADPVPAPYSVTSYYTEMSRGRLQLGGLVLPWVIVDSVDTYYEDGCNGIGVLNPCPHGGARLGQLLLAAVTTSDAAGIDWGRFDNDGPDGLPNSGDDDGVVDFVTFLQPEVDGACATTNLWAHRYDLAAWNGGAGFRTMTPVRDAGGSPVPGRFIQIRDYTLQSAVGGPLACAADAIMPIGTMAHETGHAFGLPDLYDTDLRSATVTQGIGEWGIMGSGNYSLPSSPSGFCAWSLAELGWVVVDTLDTDQPVRLSPVQVADSVRYIPVPGTDEYFLLENREPIGSDTAQLNPDCHFGTRVCAKAPGLLVWHIDLGQVLQHGFQQDNRVNSGPVHGVALVQADGLDQLGLPGGHNRGDAGDPWPGTSGGTVFGPHSIPAARDNQGAVVGFSLDAITRQPDGVVTFRFSVGGPPPVPVSLAAARDRLFGRPSLGAAQLARLDSLGNRNGRYDTGDFLALYDDHLASGGVP
jgi:M6 family metalloprotease-like protein